MPRPRRAAPGGFVYHVLNRANARRAIFQGSGDYHAFEEILAEVQERIPMRILAWCLMPNHWHLVLWPHGDRDLSTYMRLLTLTHTQRWHAYRATAGTGHLYQGRFKSFVVQSDGHFLAVCRYVEANALRAGLVARAEDWRWSSLWRAYNGRTDVPLQADEWPVQRPSNWMEYVNQETTTDDLVRVRQSVQRGTPFGQESWVADRVRELALQCTVRRRGRPEKGPDPFSLDHAGLTPLP